jgi:hypothetical protein
MASKLPGAVDKLRRHLRDAIPDGDDLQQADKYILDLLNSLHDNGESDDNEGGEEQGKRLTPSGQEPSVAGRTGFDYRGAVGLDHAFVADRRPRSRPMPAGAVKKVLGEFKPPPSAGWVR